MTVRSRALMRSLSLVCFLSCCRRTECQQFSNMGSISSRIVVGDKYSVDRLVGVHGNGAFDTGLARAMAALVRVRVELGRREVDDMLLEGLKIQCRSNPELVLLLADSVDLDALYPLESLSRAEMAFCGDFVLNGGEVVEGDLLRSLRR